MIRLPGFSYKLLDYQSADPLNGGSARVGEVLTQPLILKGDPIQQGPRTGPS